MVNRMSMGKWDRRDGCSKGEREKNFELENVQVAITGLQCYRLPLMIFFSPLYLSGAGSIFTFVHI